MRSEVNVGPAETAKPAGHVDTVLQAGKLWFTASLYVAPSMQLRHTRLLVRVAATLAYCPAVQGVVARQALALVPGWNVESSTHDAHSRLEVRVGAADTAEPGLHVATGAQPAALAATEKVTPSVQGEHPRSVESVGCPKTYNPTVQFDSGLQLV